MLKNSLQLGNSESHSNDMEKRKKEEEAVLAQMGEDPGLPAEAAEQEDSKEMNQNKNRQGKS